MFQVSGVAAVRHQALRNETLKYYSLQCHADGRLCSHSTMRSGILLFMMQVAKEISRCRNRSYGDIRLERDMVQAGICPDAIRSRSVLPAPTEGRLAAHRLEQGGSQTDV